MTKNSNNELSKRARSAPGEPQMFFLRHASQHASQPPAGKPSARRRELQRSGFLRKQPAILTIVSSYHSLDGMRAG